MITKGTQELKILSYFCLIIEITDTLNQGIENYLRSPLDFLVENLNVLFEVAKQIQDILDELFKQSLYLIAVYQCSSRENGEINCKTHLQRHSCSNY